MSIRFYTSDIEPSRTAAEIQKILSSAGARRITTTFDDSMSVRGIEFVLEIDGVPHGFQIEPDVDGMHRALQEDEDATGRRETEAQARRTAWRVAKEWLNMQLAFRACNQAPLDKLLLGFGVTPEGVTVYERLVENRQLLQEPEV